MKWHRNVVEALLPALRGVFAEGGAAERVVADLLKSQPKWGSRDRRAVAESIHEAVRWWRWHWHLAGLPADEALDPAAVTPERVAHVWAAGCWERHGTVPAGVALEPEALAARAAVPVTRAVRESVPDWLDGVAVSELGEAWPPLLPALNRPTAVFVRANTLRTTRDGLRAALAGERVEATDVVGVPDALRLSGRPQLATLRTWKDGLFEVQDAGSQLIAPHLDPQPGETVIDACAGGGGKTLHLAALMQNRGRIVAMDVHGWKLEELHRRAARAGVSMVETRAVSPDECPAELVGRADRVLLDVPCSGLGVLRRHADTKWKLTPAELDTLRATQAAILRRCSAFVRPGGRLLYVTCSILPSENERQISAFLASPEGHRWQLASEQHLLPHVEGFDAFYAAELSHAEV